MVNVGNNVYPNPLSFGSAPPAGQTASAWQGAAPNAPADAISQGAQGAAAPPQGAFNWWGSGNGPGGYIAQFMTLLFNAYTQLAQYVSGMFGTPPWGNGSPQPYGPQPNPSPTPNPQQSGGWGQPGPIGGPPSGHPGQEFFTSATASSTGDPHESFEGTTAGGQTIDGGRWNSMTNHPYLLNSDSFQGGFRISTVEHPTGPNGVTSNDSVTVESDFGRNVVTMNRDGSYSVVQDGKTLQLAVGQSVTLGDGESVTLNADHSLTVVDRNASGGEITTTLRATGHGGVNVEAKAQNVDLGGYLPHEAESSGAAGGNAAGAAGNAAAGSNAAPFAGFPGTGAYAPSGQFQPYQPYEPYQPYQPAGGSFQAEAWSPEILAGV